jgi:type I restriction enzyme M protein
LQARALLPLIFLKRLSDVFDEEKEKLAKECDNKEIVDELVEEDHSIVWFYVPKKARWSEIFKRA